jgi:hypothetical protein
VEALFEDTAIPLQVMPFQKALKQVPACSKRSTRPAFNKFKRLLGTPIALQAGSTKILACNLLLTDIAHGWVGLEPYPSLRRCLIFDPACDIKRHKFSLVGCGSSHDYTRFLATHATGIGQDDVV